jgi:hypothetical protein
MTLGGGAYSLKLPISHHLVPVDERAHIAQHFSTFLTTKEEQNIFNTNHDGRTKNTIPNRIPPPTLPTTTIPSTSQHFSIKSFD